MTSYDADKVTLKFGDVEFTGFCDGTDIVIDREPTSPLKLDMRTGAVTLTLTATSNASFDDLWREISTMTVPPGVQVQRRELAQMIHRAIKRRRRRRYMARKKRRGWA